MKWVQYAYLVHYQAKTDHGVYNVKRSKSRGTPDWLAFVEMPLGMSSYLGEADSKEEAMILCKNHYATQKQPEESE